VYTSGGRTRTSRPASFAEGTYELSFDEARPETCQLQVSAIGYEPTTSEEIRIDEGQRTIDFKLVRSRSFDKTTAGRPREEVKPTGPRRITGVVRDEKGKLVSAAIVSTRPWIAEDKITNTKGVFTLKLRGKSASRMGTMSSREETSYLLVRHRERNLAAAVELDDDAKTLDIKLAPGVILSGKVVDIEGRGIPHAELSLTFWTSNFGYGSREVTEIDAEGHFEIRAVPSGHRYSVTANADGYGERYIRVNTGDAVNNQMELEPLVLAVANLSASGIVVDELGQPVSDVRIYAYGNGQPTRETRTDTEGKFTLRNICAGRINIQANTSSPRRLRSRIQAQGGTTDIKIVVYEMDASGRRVPRQSPSLAGRPLPELKELGIDPLLADLIGKRILVCFWDMNQRPSRNCLRQLSIRAQEFKAKDIVVVAVQASKIDENSLNEWIKKYNIPFTVAMVQGDEEKARFNWGVRSLPWLILADKEHIVRAEGFSINELDEIITTVRGK